MLSCNYPLRKCASGPVGGPAAAFKVTVGRGGKTHLADTAKKFAKAVPPTVQEGSAFQECVEHEQPACSARTSARPGANMEKDFHCLRPLAAECSVGSHVKTNPLGLEEAPIACVRKSGSDSCLVQRLPRPGRLSKAVANLDDERSLLQRESRNRQHGLRHPQSRCLSSAGSMLSGSSYCTSSCLSQGMRSTVLDLELHLERERRQAAEEEIAALKAKLGDYVYKP